MKLSHLCNIKALQDANKGLKMKKFVLILWVLFSVQQVFAQGWLQRYGNRADSLNSNTSFQAIAPTQDGGYFQAGYAKGSTQLYLVKTDAEGNTITEKKYSVVKSILNEVHLADAGDGNFVIAYATDTAFGKYNLFIEKVNQNCQKIWTQSFGNGFPVYIGDLKRLSDNSFATLVTQTSRIGDSAAILKTTQQGVTFLRKTVMPLNNIRASALTESTDKALFFTTRSNGASDSARLIKTTSNAVLLWNKTFGKLDSSILLSNVHKIDVLPDGSFAILGNYFAKIDTNGTTQWFVNRKFFTFPSTFIINSDGSYSVLAGYDTLAVRKLSLYKIDNSGKILTNKTIGVFDVLSSNLALNYGLANTSDGGVVITGEEDNSFGSLARTFKIGTDGVLFVNEINGRIFIDKNKNCKFDGGEVGFNNVTIELVSRTNSNKIRRARPDSLGNYNISIDTGSYIVTLKNYGNYFTACTDAVTFKDDIQYPLSAQTLYIGLQPINLCSQMEVTVSTPALQRCQTNSYKLHYCNISGNPAQNVYATVKLDSLLRFQAAERIYTSAGTRTYRFDIGFVAAGQCGDISFTAIPACNDSTVVGQTLSVEAHIYPDSFCVVPNNWSGATLAVEGQCATDSVRLLVRNIGKSSSSAPASSTNVVIIEDVIFLKAASVSLPTQGTTKYTFPANGKTYRLEVPQEANNPGFSKAPTVSVEGCGRKSDGTFSVDYVKQFAEDDGDYFVDKDVKILRNDVFGNELDASPTGYASQHFINNNDDIEYLVRFRNTSSDTLYNVEVRDTLSDFIDPTTIELGASSLPFQMQMFEKKILKFYFNNVTIVPDAFNRDKSWGFLKFRVKLKSNIPNGTVINNRAEILFNDGSIIPTNKIFHTVGQNFVVTATLDQPTIDNNLVKINIAPNPFSEQAQFTLDTKENTFGLNTFEVYDITGRLVRREFFEGNQFIFERQNLSDQMYVFRIIIHDSKYSVSGKLMIRK